EEHDQRAVEEELHVEHGTGPQPEQAGWLHLAFGVGDEVDTTLLDLERGVLLRHLLQRLLRLAVPRADGIAHLLLQRARVSSTCSGSWQSCRLACPRARYCTL